MNRFFTHVPRGDRIARAAPDDDGDGDGDSDEPVTWSCTARGEGEAGERVGSIARAGSGADRERTLSTATRRGRHIDEALKRSVVDGNSRPRVKEKVSAEEVDVSKVAV